MADSNTGTAVPMAGLVEGRHVFYEDKDGTHAAVVTKVWDAGTGYVNLCVFAFDGTTYPATSINPDTSLGGPDGPALIEGHPWIPYRWRWMFSSQPTALTGDGGKYNK